ncbi:MAG TPA: HpsJ family protein [Coleofasciculaceae cyanobacterium]|jgi:hypothetical protein
MTPIQSDKSIYSQINKPWSTSVLRCVGYGLLVLALLDFIVTIIPLHLMDPVWEFQTMGALIERAPVPLLALGLVFYGEANYRRPWEELFLKFLCWICLLLGIFFLLMIPLGISNTMRINAKNNNEISIKYKQDITRIEQLEKQLRAVQNEDLESFFKSQGQSLNNQNSQESKQKLLSQFSSAKQTIIPTQYQQLRVNQRFALLKNSVKWNLGALVCGFVFIYIWRLTRWAR